MYEETVTMKTITRYIEAIKCNIEYHVGGNAQENFELIDASSPIDIWFHIHQSSSCHVVANIPQDLKLDKKQLLKIVVQGAVICKESSKQRSEKNVEVVYTKIENVTKSNPIGSVTITKEKKIKI